MPETPPAILAALEAAEARYDDGGCDFSVTTLIDSPRQVQLRRRHRPAIAAATTVGDRIYTLWGRAIHQVLEDACAGDPKSLLVEERLLLAVDIGGKSWVVGGQPDNLRIVRQASEYVLDEWKGVGVRSTADGIKPEWEKQLNLYAMLVEMVRGYRIDGLVLTALYRDWMRSQAGRHDYPDEPYQSFEVRLWPREQRWSYLLERLRLHVPALELPDDELPECSEEERWARPERWAVVKKGNKRATKLHNTLEEAVAHAEELGQRYQVEHRPGENVRCAGWCPAGRADVCNQWRALRPAEEDRDEQNPTS